MNGNRFGNYSHSFFFTCPLIEDGEQKNFEEKKQLKEENIFAKKRE